MQNIKFKYLFLTTLLLLVFVGCYHETISWWYIRCKSADSYYSHGFLIPFVSGYLIWLKSNELAIQTPTHSKMGLFLIIFACLLHVIGTILYIFSISGFSVFFLVLGSVLFLFGKEQTKIIIFPLVFLIFMFPLPLAIISTVSIPLKIIVAKISIVFVRALGVPILLEGFNITIPNGILVVGNPCSGLRSLISFLAIGAIFAYMADNISIFKKCILFFLSIPIAIFSNIIRVPVLILISHYKGLEAASPDTIVHWATGVFMFLIGLSVLFIIQKLLNVRINT